MYHRKKGGKVIGFIPPLLLPSRGEEGKLLKKKETKRIPQLGAASVDVRGRGGRKEKKRALDPPGGRRWKKKRGEGRSAACLLPREKEMSGSSCLSLLGSGEKEGTGSPRVILLVSSVLGGKEGRSLPPLHDARKKRRGK